MMKGARSGPGKAPGFLGEMNEGELDRKAQGGTARQRPGGDKHPVVDRKQEAISNSGGKGYKVEEGRVSAS